MLGRLIRRFAEETDRVTDGFEDVFGKPRRMSGLSVDKAGQKVARPRGRRKKNPDVSLGRGRRRRKLYRKKNGKRLF